MKHLRSRKGLESGDRVDVKRCVQLDDESQVSLCITLHADQIFDTQISFQK